MSPNLKCRLLLIFLLGSIFDGLLEGQCFTQKAELAYQKQQSKRKTRQELHCNSPCKFAQLRKQAAH